MKKLLSILTAVSIVVTCLFGGLTVLAEAYEPEVTVAKVVDNAATGRTVHGAYTAVLDGTTVDIDMEGLAYHENGQGNGGYWTGFAVVAPDGAAYGKYTFGDTTDGTALEDIDQLGTMGIAFYTDAADPDTEVKLQWFDGDDSAITEEVTLTMDLTDVNYYGVGEVTEAIVEDSDDVEAVVYSDYDVAETDGVVTITTTDLAKHTNGVATEGYWTGFAVVAPDAAATKVKYTFGDTTDGIASVEDIDQNGTMGIAFYTNAGNVAPNTEATLQWLNEAEEVLSAPVTYTIDLTNVTLDTGYTLEVTEAIVEDSDDVEAVVYSDYDVAEADGVVTITMTDLAKHTNGDLPPEEGYWTGFAVVAPDGATYGKYTFGESTGTALEDIDQNGTMGLAFYTDATEPVTEVELQWFDASDNALSNVITLEMVLDVTYEGADDITVDDVTEAIIESHDEPVVEDLYSSYGIDATLEDDGTITVAITTRGLKEHENEEGTAGYWTGFAVVAPDGAAYGKYTFGESTGTALEDIDQNGTMGIAFYVDLDDAKTEATVQWFDASDNALTNPMTFNIDVTNAKKYTAPTSTGSISVKYYTVVFESNGGTSVSLASVKKGSTVNKPADPKKEGFTFAGWYTDKELTSEYDFSSAVTEGFTLYAKWTEGETDDGAEEGTTKGFTDISEDAWYYDVVTTAIEKGLMNGMSETEFAPEASLTRGMFVTILYRLAGEPEVTGECQFADVAADQYYTNAVIWATTNGIVNGITEDTFAPNNNITREQMATIIHRFAEYAEIEVEDGEEVTYTDDAEISDYAKDAIKWAKWAGLLNGNDDGSFAPQRNSTRAEAAALFVRLLGVVE